MKPKLRASPGTPNCGGVRPQAPAFRREYLTLDCLSLCRRSQRHPYYTHFAAYHASRPYMSSHRETASVRHIDGGKADRWWGIDAVGEGNRVMPSCLLGKVEAEFLGAEIFKG